MTIIHGENIIASRDKLIEIISKQKLENQEIIRLDAKDLTEAQLESVLGANDLFETKKTILIEGMHSLLKSAKQKMLIQMCNDSKLHEIILWEKRKLTATMLKAFPAAQSYNFKASKTLFTWLDMLGRRGEESKKIGLLHSAIANDGEFFCFLMLIRQFRLLIQAKSGEKIGGSSFMASKIQKQSQQFSLEQLLKTYSQLLEIDFCQKTSANLLNMNQQLDLLTLKL